MKHSFAIEQVLDTRPRSDDPVHRTIVALDVEESTTRTNPDKRRLRRALYDLTERALQSAGIENRYLERKTDRGDGVLILIRPDDEVPKTLILGHMIPVLATLLDRHNTAVSRPELRLRLRAVVHAGEVHEDDNGFYGDDIDVACRLLDSPKLKKTLKVIPEFPLILVVSEEIYHSIIQQDYLDVGPFQPLVRVLVGRRYHRGWVNVPALLHPDRSPAEDDAKDQFALAPRLAVVPLNGRHREPEPLDRVGADAASAGGPGRGPGVNGRGGPPLGPG